MEIRVDGDTVEITGYVNAVERFSRPLSEHGRTFVEKIAAGAFDEALRAAGGVPVYLNHDSSRRLASTADGTADLLEDSIGLRARRVVIQDKEIAGKARSGGLKGWSFGFQARDDEWEVAEEGKPEKRTIKALSLSEVSLISDGYTPSYYGTSVETRGGESLATEYRGEAFEKGAKEKEKESESPLAAWRERAERLRNG
jgi:HK97 family phage prohead protease